MPDAPGVAVVTGAGGGLGRALAAALAGAGYAVVGTDVEPGPGVDRLLDVTDAAACRALADGLRPAVWVNNAGVLGAGSAATQDDAVVDRVVRVNLLGCINGTRAAVAAMRGDGSRTGSGGHVVNVASLAAWVPVPGECVYAATKAGVLSFTLGLTAELQAAGVRDVRLSVVCPDGMLTPMIAEVIDDPAVALSFSGLRLVEPEEVAARVVRLLASPRAVASVPRWRGAQVRLLGAAPGLSLRLAPLFTAVSRAQQARVARRAGAAPARAAG